MQSAQQINSNKSGMSRTFTKPHSTCDTAENRLVSNQNVAINIISFTKVPHNKNVTDIYNDNLAMQHTQTQTTI